MLELGTESTVRIIRGRLWVRRGQERGGMVVVSDRNTEELSSCRTQRRKLPGLTALWLFGKDLYDPYT